MAQVAALPEGLSGGSFAEKYELGRFICEGSFGQVWQCTERSTGDEFACKILVKDSTNPTNSQEKLLSLQNELSVLQRVRGRHTGVVQLHEALHGDRAVQVVMGLCRGGDLFELISTKGALPEVAARQLFVQLASAVQYLHSIGVTHRDIKPENILLDRNGGSLYKASRKTCEGEDSSPSQPESSAGSLVQVKLADFGLSVTLTPGEVTAGYAGSRCYVAPEVIRGKPYGRRVDVWSLGVVLCVMLTGKLPFHGRSPGDDAGLRKTILKAELDLSRPCWQGVSAEAKDLISLMLQVDPRRRARSNQLLNHSWCTAGIMPAVHRCASGMPVSPSATACDIGEGQAEAVLPNMQEPAAGRFRAEGIDGIANVSPIQSPFRSAAVSLEGGHQAMPSHIPVSATTSHDSFTGSLLSINPNVSESYGCSTPSTRTSPCAGLPPEDEDCFIQFDDAHQAASPVVQLAEQPWPQPDDAPILSDAPPKRVMPSSGSHEEEGIAPLKRPRSHGFHFRMRSWLKYWR